MGGSAASLVGWTRKEGFNLGFWKTRNKVVLNHARKLFDGCSGVCGIQVLEAISLGRTEPVRRLFDVITQDLLVFLKLPAILTNHEAVTNNKKGFTAWVLEVDEARKVVAASLWTMAF